MEIPEKLKKKGQEKAKVWLAQAEYDLEAATMSMSNGFSEWTCFQAEQAAEKALKSMIVGTGRSAPRIHKLSAIIGVVKKYVPQIREQYIEASTLQAFTFVARYPFLIPGQYDAPHNYIKEKDAKQCIQEAQAILEIAQKQLNA